MCFLQDSCYSSFSYYNRPHIEEANKLAPTFARIFKEMIIVTDPAKPMARAGKGTVQRKGVLAAYADEIERL